MRRAHDLWLLLGVKADSGGRELFRRPLHSHISEAAGLPLYSLFRIYSVFHLFLVYLRSLQAIAVVSFQVHIRLRCFSFWHGLAELFLFQCFCLANIVSEADGSVWTALKNPELLSQRFSSSLVHAQVSYFFVTSLIVSHFTSHRLCLFQQVRTPSPWLRHLHVVCFVTYLSLDSVRLHQLANSFRDPPTFTLLSLSLFTSICICIAFFSFRCQFFSISRCLPFFSLSILLKGPPRSSVGSLDLLP